MKNSKEISSYASKVGSVSPNSDARKIGRTPQKIQEKLSPATPLQHVRKRGDGSPGSLEKLMQQEEAETSVTVDEYSNHNHLQGHMPFVNQPSMPMFHENLLPPPPPGMTAPPPRPCPPANPAAYNHIPPPAIYSQGSPPLPLAGPLQLVYLQHTPAGVNIIPFQAVGFPSFSPCSPLGFPAHPHHPVVVQTQQDCSSDPGAFQYPVHDETMAHNQNQGQFIPVQYYDNGDGLFPSYQHPFAGMQQFPHAAAVYPQHLQQTVQGSNDQAPKMFRPWEDQEEAGQGYGRDTKSSSFTEEDFPALQAGMGKLNLK